MDCPRRGEERDEPEVVRWLLVESEPGQTQRRGAMHGRGSGNVEESGGGRKSQKGG